MIDLLKRRQQVMANNGGSSSGVTYTYYDWIQCDDTGGDSYIPTDLKPNLSTLWEFSGAFARTAALPSNYNYCSLFTKSKNNVKCNYGIHRGTSKSNILRANYNSKSNSESSAINPDATISVGVWNTFTLGPTEGVSYGGTLTLNGVASSYEQSSAPTSDSANEIKILWGYPARFGEFKVYYNSEMVADLRPAVRSTDNAVGLYDTVRQQFFEPTGEATFTVGNGLEDFNS